MTTMYSEIKTHRGFVRGGIWALCLMLVGGALNANAQNLLASRTPVAGGSVTLENVTTATTVTIPPGLVANLSASVNDVIQVTATPNTGYSFVRWDGTPPPGNADIPTFLYFADINRGITAVFAEDVGLTLSIDILAPGYEGLDGVGVGDVTVSVNGGPAMPYNPADRYASNDLVRITAVPGLYLGTFQSYVFEWDGDIPETLAAAARPHPVAFNMIMTESKEVTLLFSREYHAGEGVGDLDLDGLPDIWEIRYGLDPKVSMGDDGPEGNIPGDLSMPTGWIHNQFASGAYPAAIGGLYTTWPYRFHDNGTRPLNYYVGMAPFSNWLRARGFDGYYGVNPLTGLNDDPHSNILPGVNPNLLSTAGDGISDGWKYWFWGSAINYDGVTTLPVIEGEALDVTFTDPNSPAPTVAIDRATILGLFSASRTLGVDPSEDVDNDCASFLDEFLNGTDPIHWDTDADLMPDGYEIRQALNPLNPNDADASSGDWMAFHVDGGTEYRHNQVYSFLGFDPRTGWGQHYLDRKVEDGSRALTVQPNTIAFTHLEKYRASVYLADLAGEVFNCQNFSKYALSVTSIDSDSDGIFDGWELYVGLNPLDPVDAGLDDDNDKLTNFQEFSAYDIDLTRGTPWPNGFQHYDSLWLNKVWPTDINNEDTDGDGVRDDVEAKHFKYAGGTVTWNGACYTGGGLNPTSVDTDNDYLPDHWEMTYRSSVYDIADLEARDGMDGTLNDYDRDYDGDGLLNYQEYLVASVHHFRYGTWVSGLPLGSYDPFDFFTGIPNHWDWGVTAGIYPYQYIENENTRYTSTNPRDADTDADGMDDYWELYYGLNPIFGLYDRYREMIANQNNIPAGYAGAPDIRVQPHIIGFPYLDPDQDGIPNIRESIAPDHPVPSPHHTGPSPLWVTDHSYERSFVNLYMAWDPNQPWYFDAEVRRGTDFPPTYLFDLARNEGFDSDGDFISDRGELLSVPSSPGYSDPQDVQTPHRRSALFLEGDSAARTRIGFAHSVNSLENFTVEAWVRPVEPAKGRTQVIVERPILVPDENMMAYPEGIRLNFRLGLDATGRPFVSYNGAGFDGVYFEAKAPGTSALLPDKWYHLAGVYDGVAKTLRLYVNGRAHAELISAEGPFSGWGQGNTLPGLGGPIVVGAEDLNPDGAVDGHTVWVGPGAGAVFPQPLLQNHFEGWVDEVRIWDGARSEMDINALMARSLSMEDIDLQASASSSLFYLYTFDSLADPFLERVVPEGFDLLNGRPNDGTYPHVAWWGLANDRSLVYDNYLFVPWIPNLVARRPVSPPRDSPISTNANFPNTANYINYGYEHAPAARMQSTYLANDLLPLGMARGDISVELWDNLGVGGPEWQTQPDIDENHDGIPDWWQRLYWPNFDPNLEGAQPWDPFADPDGDGLSNLNEYRADLNPILWDTVGDNVSDGQRDSDGDGLTNLYEQDTSGTRLDIVDTDDDGHTDWEEVTGQSLPLGWVPGDPMIAAAPGMKSNPLSSLDPPTRMSMRVSGDGHLAVTNQPRHALKSWTIQGWVWPDALTEGIILRRRVWNPYRAQWGVNYELGVQLDGGNLRPYARFIDLPTNGVPREVRVDGLGPSEIVGGQQATTLIRQQDWTHLAASYDAGSHTLSLYINGELSTYRTDAFEPIGLGLDEEPYYEGEFTVGGGDVIAGVVTDGFSGYLDDIIVMGGATDKQYIQDSANRANSFTAALNTMPAAPPYAPKMLPLQDALNFDYVSDQLLVRFKSDVSPTTVQDTLLNDLGLDQERRFAVAPIYLMKINDGMTVSQKLEQVRGNSSVLYAEPNYKVQKLEAPNDPLYDSMWAMNNTGQTGGTPGADIGAEAAWDRTRGSTSVRVAVIDSGVDYNHPDLSANMWSGIGYDFWEDDADPMDEEGHGTHVAGTIGALGDNGVGVVGVNWRVNLMAIRFLGPFGFGFTSDAIEGVEYSWVNGARISNNSWGGGGYSQALYDAIAAAGAAGQLFVAAAGNSATDNDSVPSYPANYALPNIISVAASDANDARAVFSNFGLNSVHLAAPGASILSTTLGGGYGTKSGTSMATPHVSGVAALLLAQNPGLSVSALRKLILDSVDKLDSWEGLVQTGGRLSAARAVSGRGAMIAYFPFNDGGETAEDFTMANDWENDWAHAGVFVNDAMFANVEFFDSKIDSNEDGIPDWWYEVYGFDPFDESIALQDPDGDGLNNLYEYLSGTNPFMADSNGNGTLDAYEDSNGDGLTNLQNQEQGTHPMLSDTDDDGISDSDEIANDSDPLSEYDPFTPRAMSFSGNGRLLVRTERDVDAAKNWTVEAWVRPDGDNQTAVILRRAETFSFNGVRWIDYELGLDSGIPYITYTYRQGGTDVTVRVDALKPIPEEWTHLAAVLDDTDSQLRLFVNGKRVAYARPAVRPPISIYGVFETTMGGGDLDGGGNVLQAFVGEIDAVRVWDYARSGLEIQHNRDVLLPEFTDGVVDMNRSPSRLFNFDSGGQYAHNSRYAKDWLTDWVHSASLQGDAAWVDAVWPPRVYDADDDALSDHDENTGNWAAQRSEIPFAYRALEFDGTPGTEVFVDERVDNEATMHYALTNWTVETWVRPTDLPVGEASLIRRITKANNKVTFELGVLNDGGVVKAYARFNRSDAGNDFVSLTHTFALPVGTGPSDWTHLAATFDSGHFALYINGAQVRSETHLGAQPFVAGLGELYLGSENFIGQMQEVRIWEKPRTAQEIQDQYQNVLLFATASLEGSYDSGNPFLGRPTETREDGLVYDYSQILFFDLIPFTYGRHTHKFTVEAWVKMEPGAVGGIVAERKVNAPITDEENQWFINHSLRITDNGAPQALWDGQVTILTPVREDQTNGPSVVIGFDAAAEFVQRNLTSEIDIRDGQWHHLAIVGDSRRVRLYVDGVLDRINTSYYTFRVREDESFESFYFTHMPISSELRIADGGLDALVDEVAFWNEDLTPSQIQQHMDYGLDKADIQLGLQPIDPLPDNAIDPGGPRHRLVSYVTFDGELAMPFVPDRANANYDYRIYPQATGAEILNPSSPPIVVDRVRTFERQLKGYFATFDGGEHVENYMRRNDYGYSGLLLGNTSFTTNLPTEITHLILDSDGDGLPDWWELFYNLDPGSVLGDDGPWGDPDGDGLHNLAEYQAGTDPRDYDTAGDGYADFDSRPGPGMPPWGWQFTDNTGMAALWQTMYPGTLSPLVYDGHLDPDGDGWSSYAEFMASTSPEDATDIPRPLVNVEVKYTGPYPQGVLRILAYSKASMDGVPDAMGTAGDSQAASSQAVGVIDASGQRASGALGTTPIVPGSVRLRVPRNVSFYIDFIDLGNGVLRSTDVIPVRFGQIDYDSGDWSVNLAPNTFAADLPVSGEWSYFTGFSSYPFDGMLTVVDGHLREGDNWFFAFIDRDGTGTWNPGDPAGIAQAQPVNIGWGEVPTITFGLTDELVGYPRFTWPVIDGMNMYTVTIRRTTSAGTPIVLSRILDQRNYFHEGDMLYDGKFGLDAGGSDLPGYQWIVSGGTNAANGTFGYNWTNVLATPKIVSPVGNVPFARNDFSWTMDTNTVSARVRIMRGAANGPVVYNAVIPAPFRELNGQYTFDLPLYAGDRPFTNGVYYWDVQAMNPRKTSVVSTARSFAVNLGDGPGDAYAISGVVSYFGNGPTTNIIVQAFRSPGFSGRPDAQITMTNTGPYKLMGLRAGTYHVRAFIDQNPSKTLQNWESWGFVRNYLYGGDYQVYSITLPGNKIGQDLVIRDRDTNNNRIADAWEFMVFGSLNGDAAIWDTDKDGLTDWEEQFVHGSDPFNSDTSGDGLSDGYKVSLGLSPTLLDSDGDGYADALEILLGSDPTDALSTPSSSILLSIVSVMPGVSQDLISYDFDPGVISISTNVTAYLSATPTLGMPFMPVPDSYQSIYTTNWTTGPWVYTNTPPAHEMQFYRIDWKIKNN